MTTNLLLQGGLMVGRKAHNLEIDGSIPSPARKDFDKRGSKESIKNTTDSRDVRQTPFFL